MGIEVMKDLSTNKNNHRSNIQRSLEEIFQELKFTYLPELKSLYDDCIWLTSKLELGGKKELQSSETRLIQFVSVLSSTIKQIEGLKDSSNTPEWEKIVVAIESKIVKTILPVRARILSKLEDKSQGLVATNTFAIGESGKKESGLQKSSFPSSVTVTEPPSPSNKRIRADDCTDSESLTASESSISPILPISTKAAPTAYPSYQSGSTFSRSVGLSQEKIHIPITVMQQPEQIPQIPINTNSTIYYSSATDPTINGSLSSNLSSNEEEFVSSRRRRRLNQIVPNPRKPRQADYNCSVCNETYSCIVQDNPWWAVYHHECPKCHSIQVPRIDISLNSNAVENDPNVTALYGEGIDDSGDECDDESGSEDGNEDDDDVEGDNPEEQVAEDEVDDEKPFDGEGLLAQEEASKLLVLMCHARTCSGFHASPKHAEICRSTKFLMLHIRDCTGRDVHARECKFPWCLPCKKMLRHLTRCYDPANCAVCNPWTLPESYQQLRALNQMSTMPVA